MCSIVFNMPATSRFSKSKFSSAMNPAKRLTDRPLPENGQPGGKLTPLMASCDFVPQGDGSYRAIPRKPLDKVTVREAVRLSNYSRDTIYRLYNSGFITGERQSPRRILIHVASLQAHILAARDPGFWTPERRLRYWGV